MIGDVRAWAIRCVMMAVTVSAVTRAAEEPAFDRTIELPKFVVTDSRELPPPESWRYAKIPGFEILSNASDRATQRLIEDFALFRFALGYVWPMPERSTAPISLIVCGQGGKFAAFAPTRPNDGGSTRASLFLDGEGGRDAIVINYEATVLNVLPSEVDDPDSGVDSSRIAVDHRKQLNREYVRALLSEAEPRLPAWFEEGMAQIMMAMRVDRTTIEFGKIDPPNVVSAAAGAIAEMNAAAAAQGSDSALLGTAPIEDRDFNAVLQRQRLLPMERLLAVPRDAPEASHPLGNNVWAKQAYAFVHLGLFGERGRFRKPFATYLARVAREPATEAIFKECFDMSYKDMGLQLRGYIQYTTYTSTEFRARKGETLPRPPPLELREATPAEIGRIKGETLVLAGQRTAARTELIAPYIRGERDPQLLAALGLFERAAGEHERARKFLTAAVEAKTTRGDAFLALARYAFADAMANPAAPRGQLTSAQAVSVAALLSSARVRSSDLPEIYELAADTWLQCERAPTKDELTLLVDGVKRFPGRLKLVYKTAVLCREAGLADAAHSLVDHGITRAIDAATKQHFAELKAALPPMTEPPPVGPTGNK